MFGPGRPWGNGEGVGRRTSSAVPGCMLFDRSPQRCSSLPFFPLSLPSSLSASPPPSPPPPLCLSLAGALVTASQKDLAHRAARAARGWPRVCLWGSLKGVWPAFLFLPPHCLFLQTVTLNDSSASSILMGIKLPLFSLLPTSPAKPLNPTAPRSQHDHGRVANRCGKEGYRFPWFLYKGNPGQEDAGGQWLPLFSRTCQGVTWPCSVSSSLALWG